MKLADYLSKTQLSDEDFAARCEVDRTTILRVRTGKNKPSPQLMARIALETGGAVQPNDYFDGLPESAAA